MLERENFRSRLGFILVSAGCAIGIGNVWKFPYMAGQGGGGGQAGQGEAGGQQAREGAGQPFAHGNQSPFGLEKTEETAGGAAEKCQNQRLSTLITTWLQEKVKFFGKIGRKNRAHPVESRGKRVLCTLSTGLSTALGKAAGHHRM